MKKLAKFNKAFFLLLLLITSVKCSQATEPTNNDVLNYSQSDTELINLMNNPADGEINESEASAIIFMREEEKLARDVYRVLGAQWNLKPFINIQNSEQTHMNSIKWLIDSYKLSDPVVNDETGLFTNSVLLNLYNQLIDSGKNSDIEALKVGAAIEEIDIVDLDRNLKETAINSNVIKVFTNLRNGSYNHLKAFVKNLSSKGIVYQPQYLDKNYYDSIIQ